MTTVNVLAGWSFNVPSAPESDDLQAQWAWRDAVKAQLVELLTSQLADVRGMTLLVAPHREPGAGDAGVAVVADRPGPDRPPDRIDVMLQEVRDELLRRKEQT
jgi:hypothetical protein